MLLGAKVPKSNDPNPRCDDPDLELEARDIPASVDWT
jgi:hypothetical protein